MSGVARMGDLAIGVCTAHVPPLPVTGTIVMGEPTVLVAGAPAACVGDSVAFSCGHVGTIALGTMKCTCKGKPLAMIGSPVVGSMQATIVLGAPTVIAN